MGCNTKQFNVTVKLNTNYERVLKLTWKPKQVVVKALRQTL